MLDMFDVIGIIHFGIAGNVNSSMSIGDVSIPREFANTGIWDWLKSNATIPSNDVAHLKFGNYNVPKGANDLGDVGFTTEQFYDSKTPNDVQEKFWFASNKKWLRLASLLQGMKLEKCVNSTFCLDQDPKLIVGLKGSTSEFFVANAAYRQFLFNTFQVSSADMESSAVVMTCLSNGYPVIVIRSLSDLAGAEDGENVVSLFGGLAATNAAKVVIAFIKIVSLNSSKLFFT
ncbi:hypothetical protein LIER_14155 [Lithospermum erythrorhizon]|uniref:Nucleoside phosphorylase domain-containing protein n=1 Tax=Lithospermum erythrorhizon TaxID=34254 RepID=A0AAV3PY78_LITER